MRAQPSRPCTNAKCKNLQPCALHERKPWARSGPYPTPTSGWAWQRRRRRILERDGYRCRSCGGQATVVHHRVGRAQGGGDDDSNLEAYCRPCNERERRREAREGRGPGNLER